MLEALYHRTLLRTPNSPVRDFSPQIRAGRRPRSRFLSLLLACLCLALAGCRPSRVASPTDPWAYADLRALDPAGASSPSLDLIALYTRQAGGDLQVRLDLLDLDYEPAGDLYLALDWASGGTRVLPIEAEAGLEWDVLLVLPAQGRPYALAPPGPGNQDLTPFPALIPRIARVPWQDMLVVSFNPHALEGIERGFSLQAFLTPPGDPTPAGSLGPLESDARPPGRAPVILAFWNSYPAYTPAQALRRWDGAHTGPFGGRHGLHVLLQAARRARVPVALLDVKTPEALSALDYLGGLETVKELAGEGLLVLPDALPGSPALLPSPQALPGWAVARSALESRRAGEEFGLQASPILYSPSLELLKSVTPASGLPAYAWIAAPLPDSGGGAQPLRWKTSRLLPLTPAPEEHALRATSATPEGLSLELRLALLANALASVEGDSPLLVLGGDLVDSAWGEPESARASMQYIAGHPWIHPYGKAELLRLRPDERLEQPAPAPGSEPFSRPPAGSVDPSGSAGRVPLFSTGAPEENAQIPIEWIDQLAASIDSRAFAPALSQAAWQAYRSLFAPLPPEHSLLPAVRARYAWLPGLLLEAARWAARPGPLAHCDLALDQEGRRGCILASERVFSAYDPLGGRLLVLFVYSPDGKLHQLVAPTSQFTVGFGDPSTWDPDAGPGAEPGGIHGAFAGSPPPWESYTPQVAPDRLSFTSQDGSLTKNFTLLERGLRVEFPTPPESGQVRIPLALDPWERFKPGWGDRYQESSSEQAWSWQMEGGPELEVRASASLKADLFSDSRPHLVRVEDPNFPYPLGHYLPFPLAVLEVTAEEGFFMEINLK